MKITHSLHPLASALRLGLPITVLTACCVPCFAQPATLASADEVALDLTDANALFSFGHIDFLAASAMDLGSSQQYEGTIVNGAKLFTLDDVDLDGSPTEDLALYGALQVLGVWTPASTTPPTVDLFVVRD